MRRAGLVALALAWLAAPVTAQEAARVTFGYVGIAGDPRHAARELYANLVLRPAVRPLDGAQTAMRDARILGRALKLAFALEPAEVVDLESAHAALDRLRADAGVRFVLVDLPAPLLGELAARTRGEPVVLLNVSAEEDELRGAACAPHLLHVIPSRAMLADALGQYLAAMNWREVLTLVGQDPASEALGRSLAAGITRFGGKIVATRKFAAGRDPRQRELNNVRLLTQGVAYDVVLVADADGEFARTLPYQTVLPRPVVGSHGLVPAAWHWAFERHGAPQLNQRFERQVDGARRMADTEWAAWAAIRSLLEAHARAGSADPVAVERALRDAGVTLDVYKGAPASFRPWDGQLRQPLLLGTADAVIGRAPLERFLHERNTLDTLGVDAPQTACGG
jgi:ABC transporter substrate binding protein (PQQ-dependent alcohol dehydrogenase system)